MLGFVRRTYEFSTELQITVNFSKKTGDMYKLYIMCFVEAMYHVWRQRNEKVFNKKCRDESAAIKEILIKVACRATEKQIMMLIL